VIRLLILALVAIDTITRYALATPPGLMHHRPIVWAVVMVVGGAYFYLRPLKFAKTSPKVIGLAMILNGADGLDGSVHNPFVVFTNPPYDALGFNAADVYAVVGLACFLVACVTATRLKRRREARV
jgi:lipoprotein signal peptidase